MICRKNSGFGHFISKINSSGLVLFEKFSNKTGDTALQ